MLNIISEITSCIYVDWKQQAYAVCFSTTMALRYSQTEVVLKAYKQVHHPRLIKEITKDHAFEWKY